MTIPDQWKVRELPRKNSHRRTWRAKKNENYHAKPVQDPFKTIAEHRKTRELTRKCTSKKLKSRKNYENYHAKPVCVYRGHPESTRITTKNEHRRSWRAGKTTRITTKNPVRVHRESTRITEKNEHPNTKVRELPRIPSATSDLNPAF